MKKEVCQLHAISDFLYLILHKRGASPAANSDFSPLFKAPMKPLTFLVLFFALSATVFGAEYSVSGRVFDASGKPAVGAVVRQLNLAENSAETDAQGRFTITLQEMNNWTILWAFSADAAEQGKDRLKIEEGNPTIPEITIRLTDDVRMITGTVLDHEGKPVADALVGGDCRGWGFPSLCTTAPDGTFRFPWDKKEPLLRIYAVKENVGFNLIGTEELEENAGPTPLDRISDGPFEITLKKPQTLRVHVTDQNRQPLAGCPVRILEFRRETPEGENENTRAENERSFGTYFRPGVFQTITNENGDAAFDWIPTDGFSRIEFYSLGPESGLVDADGNAVYYGSEDALYSFKNPRDLTISLPNLARLEGKVVYSDGSPACCVRVSINYENGHGLEFADFDGVFRLRGNPGTTVNLGVESFKEATPGVFRINLGDGSEVKRPTFTLKKGTRLRGFVFGPDMTPHKGEFFVMATEKSPDPTRPDDRIIRQTNDIEALEGTGMYEFMLPPGRFTIYVSGGERMRGVEETLEISPGEEDVWLDLQLKSPDEPDAEEDSSED